jgi:hypothetical protein
MTMVRWSPSPSSLTPALAASITSLSPRFEIGGVVADPLLQPALAGSRGVGPTRPVRRSLAAGRGLAPDPLPGAVSGQVPRVRRAVFGPPCTALTVAA